MNLKEKVKQTKGFPLFLKNEKIGKKPNTEKCFDVEIKKAELEDFNQTVFAQNLVSECLNDDGDTIFFAIGDTLENLRCYNQGR